MSPSETFFSVTNDSVIVKVSNSYCVCTCIHALKYRKYVRSRLSSLQQYSSIIITVLADQVCYFRQPSFEVQGFSVYGSVLLKEGVSGLLWRLALYTYICTSSYICLVHN